MMTRKMHIRYHRRINSRVSVGPISFPLMNRQRMRKVERYVKVEFLGRDAAPMGDVVRNIIGGVDFNSRLNID